MMLRPTTSGIDPGPDITPCAIVKRLLLTPEQARIGVLVKVGGDLGEDKSMRLQEENEKATN
jgi:hypothetical protein